MQSAHRPAVESRDAASHNAGSRPVPAPPRCAADEGATSRRASAPTTSAAGHGSSPQATPPVAPVCGGGGFNRRSGQRPGHCDCDRGHLPHLWLRIPGECALGLLHVMAAGRMGARRRPYLSTWALTPSYCVYGSTAAIGRCSRGHHSCLHGGTNRMGLFDPVLSLGCTRCDFVPVDWSARNIPASDWALGISGTIHQAGCTSRTAFPHCIPAGAPVCDALA